MNPSSSNARLRPFRPVPFGRYTLLTQLATGGMGEIFLARLEGMQGFEKLCVIKKILPQLAEDPEFVERFLGEARTLVKLSHGSIAQVLDMGLHEGDAYMALEHVDGKDLRKVAARARDKQKPLPVTFVLFVMGRVLDALAYAHRKKGDDEGELNLVHRDISPQNILISYEGEVKVIDFGLAKSRLSAAKTNPSIILGKFLYMSPEQARHQPVDRRSDLYAVGLCLYELLSGRNPFDALPAGELMSAVASPNIPPLAQVAPGVPASVSQLVMKALAVEPAQRFQAAEELRGRINACLVELDAAAGPEDISRYMHELFASEYLTERRMLVMLREVGRAPEVDAETTGEMAGSPPRPMSMLPPKTIRLDGPVEALSFKPTPRTRDGAPGRDDGETRPGVALEEPTSPEVVLDEPTRPSVALEAIEESRRAQEVPASRPPPPPPPLSARTLDDVPPMFIENTPAWSESLVEDEEEAPVVFGTEELLEPEEPEQAPDEAPHDMRLDDTQPRIQMPRAPSRDVYHEETQPRVVLDESLLRDTGEPEAPSMPRPRPSATRLPRRRVVTTGVSRPSAVRPALPSAPPPETEGADEGAYAATSGDEDGDRTEERPQRRERRYEATDQFPAQGRAAPRRRWWPLVVAVVSALGVVGLWTAVMLQQPSTSVSNVPPPRPLPRPIQRGEPPAPAVPPPTEQVPPAAPPPTAALMPVGEVADAGQAPDAGQALDAGGEADAGLALLDAGAGLDAGLALDAGGEPDAGLDSLSSLLEPDVSPDLEPEAPAPNPVATKAPGRNRPRAPRKQTELQVEWARTRSAYAKLTRDIGCANLDLLCSRYEKLKAEMDEAGDAENPQLLDHVKQLLLDIRKKTSTP